MNNFISLPVITNQIRPGEKPRNSPPSVWRVEETIHSMHRRGPGWRVGTDRPSLQRWVSPAPSVWSPGGVESVESMIAG